MMWLLYGVTALLVSLFIRSHGIYVGSARALSLCLLILSLSEIFPEKLTHNRDGYVLLQDVSESMDSELIKKGRMWAQDFPIIKELYFGEETHPESSVVNKNATDIESALKEASKFGNKILLISDGFETKGDALSRQYKIEINPFIGDSSGLIQKPHFSYVKAPSLIEEGKSPQIFFTVTNNTEVNKTLTVSVDDGEVPHKKEISLSQGGEDLLSEILAPMKNVKKSISLKLFDGESIVDKKTLSIYPKKRTTILFISPEQSDPLLFKEINSELLFPVMYSTPEKVSDEIIKDANVIIINNTKKEQLSSSAQKSINEKVNQGTSLYFFGGNTAFGLGNWIGTEFEKLFPVKLLPPESKQKRANVAVSLVLDRSQSMREEGRLESAKQAAIEVINSLKDDDFVGVMGFDKSPFPVVPLTRLQGNRERAIDRLKILRPWGKTDPLLAINLAREELEKAQAARKHIIFLTDGELPYGGPTYTELVKQLRFSGITFSSVLIGPEFDSLMREMAQVGGGTFYNTSDPSTLPRIFMRDIYVKSGEETLKENELFKVERNRNSVRTISLDEFPPVLGFNQNEILPQATTELIISSQGKNYPFYSWMNVGKGKTHAFTSDLSGRWTNNWSKWSKHLQFFNELFSEVRGDEKTPLLFDFGFNLKGNTVKIEFTTYGSNIPDHMEIKTFFRGKEESLSLTKEAKGRFTTELPALPGEYEIEVQNDGSKVGFTLEDKDIGEQKGQGVNKEFLRALARITGGEINTTSHLKDSPSPHSSYYVSPVLLVLSSLIVWLFEVFARELGVKRLVSFVRSSMARQKSLSR